MLTATDPKGETTTYGYDPNGYLTSVDGPLPGPQDTVTSSYDAFGRVRTLTDVSGYTLTYDYDNLDRITRVTHPDSTFEQITYGRLDPVVFQDRAGRQTLLEYNSLRQLTKKTDPLQRVTQTAWCSCGAIKSLTDPLGRTTTWQMDVQGRRTAKRYPDGSQVSYVYEDTTSRLKQVVDESLQIENFSYNLDDTLASISYVNCTIPTPSVNYIYDPNYQRVTSRSDGAGTTLYSYNPITTPPALGSGLLASVTGPLTNALITYSYDELGRPVHRTVNGVDSAVTFDAAGRAASLSNALGSFICSYDGSSDRLLSQSSPNGLTEAKSYGNNLQDFQLQQITHTIGATPISQFVYGRDVPANQITSWSQQPGAQAPSIFGFGYDAANQLLSATVTNSGVLVNTYAYSYDLTGNRLSEQVGSSTYNTTYNALNQLNATSASVGSRSNEWDGAHRLVAVNLGNQRAEFTYDGKSRLVGIRQLQSGVEVSHRFLLWIGGQISEEHDTNGTVTKRFFAQGVKLLTGTNAGSYLYTRDHLGSIRELTDSSGNVRARYSYDPFGRRTKVSGDLDADFGFAGMFWSSEANLSFTHFRAYDPGLGRWLSRDPLKDSEVMEGPNLYSYVANDPAAVTDPLGLFGDDFLEFGGGGVVEVPTSIPDLQARLQAEWEEHLNRRGMVEEVPPYTGSGELRDLTLQELDEELNAALLAEDEDRYISLLRQWGQQRDELLESVSRLPSKPSTVEPPEPRFPGVSAVGWQFIGAGLTILTMTDCDTVNGIFGLMRVQRGELLNESENNQMKQLNQQAGW
jgi:RHS repeat-associated protein